MAKKKSDNGKPVPEASDPPDGPTEDLPRSARNRRAPLGGRDPVNYLGAAAKKNAVQAEETRGPIEKPQAKPVKLQFEKSKAGDDQGDSAVNAGHAASTSKGKSSTKARSETKPKNSKPTLPKVKAKSVAIVISSSPARPDAESDCDTSAPPVIAPPPKSSKLASQAVRPKDQSRKKKSVDQGSERHGTVASKTKHQAGGADAEPTEEILTREEVLAALHAATQVKCMFFCSFSYLPNNSSQASLQVLKQATLKSASGGSKSQAGRSGERDGSFLLSFFFQA